MDQLNERFAPLLEDELLIASSVLNPRQKLRVFQSTLAEGLHKPNAACAVAAVNKLLLHLEEVSYNRAFVSLYCMDVVMCRNCGAVICIYNFMSDDTSTRSDSESYTFFF